MIEHPLLKRNDQDNKNNNTNNNNNNNNNNNDKNEENDNDNEGQIISEMRRKGGVKWSTYNDYIKDMGVIMLPTGILICVIQEVSDYS